LHEDVSPGDYNTIERFIREIRHIEPDIIISAIYPEEAQYYANILRELRWRRTVWIDYFAASNKYYTEMLRDTENIFGVSQWEPEIETPENKNFVHEYRKNFDELPDSLSAAAYSAGILVGEAIKKANSAERRDIQMELMNLK
jgi:ABC-type branched-subunit amino acid transport system substrate-binding protein